MKSFPVGVRRLSNQARSRSRDSTVPDQPANNDLYIVEFPKSGITWLCTLITNYCLLASGFKIRATHFNLEHFIGDVHQVSHLRAHPAFSGLRLIKSHSPYHPAYRHVIYLIRNPMSVMLSYYHFASGRGEFVGSLEEFIRHPKYGVDAWVQHVESWLEPPRQLKLQLVRYEDLKANPEMALKDLLRSLGLELSEHCLTEAVARSEFSEMRKDADHYRARCPFRTYDFVRQGQTDAELGDAETNIILSRAGSTLGRLYPGEY